jgi:5'-nucleotidase
MTNLPFGTYDPASAQVNSTTPTAPGSPRLYLDLDGVMADFDAHFPATFGLDHRGMADDALWETINAHPSYFRDMPPCPGAVAFFRTIEHLDPIILTACPKSAYAEVARQKRAWVREHLSKDVVILPVMGGKSKPLFMHAPGDILIDDFVRNTDAWTAEGGVAILHKTFAETSARLRTALGPLLEPREMTGFVSTLTSDQRRTAVAYDGPDTVATAEPPAIEFTYRNWRGETAVRKVRPSHLWYGATDWHPEPQWLLHALDCEKDAYRDFALVDMHFQTGLTYQARVGHWIAACFTPEIAEDMVERCDRFTEESLELGQSLGHSRARAHALVDYVYDREPGEPGEEVGGVMNTLAALCNTARLDLGAEAERELARVNVPATMEKIRAKQKAKPTGSALPVPPA